MLDPETIAFSVGPFVRERILNESSFALRPSIDSSASVAGSSWLGLSVTATGGDTTDSMGVCGSTDAVVSGPVAPSTKRFFAAVDGEPWHAVTDAVNASHDNTRGRYIFRELSP